MFDPTLLHEYLGRSAKKYPEKEALIFEEQRFSYSQIDALSTQLAYQLIKLGVKRHNRVLIFLDNCPEAAIALFAILKAGATFVMLNGAIKAPKLSYILQDSGATLLITHGQKSKIVTQALSPIPKALETIIWIGERSNIPDGLSHLSHNWSELIENKSEKVNFPRVIDADLATLIYTSGSTGEPKGIMSTHHQVISAARSIINYLENRPDDIIINTLPLSFDYGLYQVIMSVMFGGTVVLEKTFMFPVEILKRIKKEKVTGFPIVPTILAMLLNIKDIQKYNLSSLRYLSNTGAALPVEHIRRLRELLPDTRIYSMYGLTECKRVSYLPPALIDQKPKSVGIPMPNCEVFVVDDNGKELPPGEIGELVIRGSNVMSGYWNDPELTAKTYRQDLIPGETVLFSGDLFKKDDEGYLYFVGRRDDMIKTKGERVSPKEIENMISHLSGVREVAIIGIPDDILGKSIKAFIVLDNKIKLLEQQVRKYCSENLEIFMVPKYIEFIEELPKTPNGKVDKQALSRRSFKNRD